MRTTPPVVTATVLCALVGVVLSLKAEEPAGESYIASQTASGPGRGSAPIADHSQADAERGQATDDTDGDGSEVVRPLTRRAVVPLDEKTQLVDFQPPPTQPPAPVQPPSPTDSPFGRGEGSEGRIGLAFASTIEQTVRSAATPAGTPGGAASGQESLLTAPTDTGAMLSQSLGVESVQVQRRASVSFDPHIRGYKSGQIYTDANGVYWTPARLDLDTMLNKIDPGMTQDVIVLSGPYGLRHGPGFAFIDVERSPTPRYANGFEAHFDSTFNILTNGGQLYGRETVTGGGSDWGFRFSYGNRKGSDYEAGNDLKIPSSYHNQDFWAEVSYDVAPHRRIEFAYQRLDQTDTEYPAQMFDLNFLGTYGFEARMVDDDPSAPWTKLSVEAWYNRTRFQGDTFKKNNPTFPVGQRIDYAAYIVFAPYGFENLFHFAGTTQGAAASSGARALVTVGDKDETQLRVGADFRYLGQAIREDWLLFYDSWPFIAAYDNLPHAWMQNPGMFLEMTEPVSDAWTLAAGARVDYVHTTARAAELAVPSGLVGAPGNLPQQNFLYACYLTSNYKLDSHWTLNAGVGGAQRPPTLIERYADGLYLGILQSGFSQVEGYPGLRPEQDWQVDLGLSADYPNWRGKLTGFHAWVLDYITFNDLLNTMAIFESLKLLQYTNTRLATLAGFELAGEYDLTPGFTTFGKLSYVDGRDREINAPLPAMSPLDGTLGLRWHDADKGRRWGVEGEVRMVAAQHRLGAVHYEGGALTAEDPTPGFAVFNVRGYYNPRPGLSLVAGVDNLFNKTYLEHLDLRLDGPAGYDAPPTEVWRPGITPYCGVNWVF